MHPVLGLILGTVIVAAITLIFWRLYYEHKARLALIARIRARGDNPPPAGERILFGDPELDAQFDDAIRRPSASAPAYFPRSF